MNLRSIILIPLLLPMLALAASPEPEKIAITGVWGPIPMPAIAMEPRQQPTSPFECSVLLPTGGSQGICLYSLGIGQSYHAKLYKKNKLTDAPDGQYRIIYDDLLPGLLFVYKGIVYSMDRELETEIMKPNAGQLLVLSSENNGQLIFFCPRGRVAVPVPGDRGGCPLANGNYTSIHGLEIPIKDGRIDYKSNHSRCTYGHYGHIFHGSIVKSGNFDGLAKAGMADFTESPDKTEYVACAGGD